MTAEKTEQELFVPTKTSEKTTDVEVATETELSVVTGKHSSEVIQAIFNLHFPTVSRVLDMTYGKGNFWKWPYRFSLTGADIAHDKGGLQADSRRLPFDDASFDVAVIDPPFMHGATANGYSSTVGLNRDFSRLCSQAVVLTLYKALLQEAYRLVSVGVVVKCKDIIESGKFAHMSAKVSAALEEVGFVLDDKVVFVPDIVLARDPRWKQWHFRRQESYFLIGRKKANP